MMSKWDRKSLWILGQEGAAVQIQEAVGEVPRGRRRPRRSPLLLHALASLKMLHIPMYSTSFSLLEDLVHIGPTRTSSGEGYSFVLLVRDLWMTGCYVQGESFADEKLVKLGHFEVYRESISVLPWCVQYSNTELLKRASHNLGISERKDSGHVVCATLFV